MNTPVLPAGNFRLNEKIMEKEEETKTGHPVNL
jgi:hypothetical protein